MCNKKMKMKEINEWLEKLEKHDELLDEDLEKAIKEYEASGKPIYNRLFFVDEYGNPISHKKSQRKRITKKKQRE